MKPEQLDRYMKLFKRINEILKEEGVQEISDDSISKFVTDTKRQQTHEKAKEKAKIFDKGKAQHSLAKEELKDNKKTGLAMLDRAIPLEMDLSGTPEALEHNKEMAQKFTDEQFCIDYVNKTFAQLNDIDWESEFSEITDIASIVDAYDKHPQLNNLAFISGNTGTVLKDKLYNPDLKNLFDKKEFIQQLNAPTSSLQIAANEAYLVLPDEAFTPERIEVIMNKASEIQAEFPDICDKEVFSLANLAYTFVPSNDVAAQINLAKAVNTGKIPANFLMEYHFTKDGKEVPSADVLNKLSHGQSIDEYKAVKEDPEIIARQKEALSGSVYGSIDEFTKVPLDENPGLQRLLGEKIATMVGYGNDQKVKESVFDKDKQRHHQEALKLKAHEKAQNELMKEVCNELGIKCESGPQYRLVATYIDTSNTEQAKKNNIELMKKASTPEGILEINNKAIKEILSLDIKDIYSKENSLESYLEHSMANNDRNRRCFVLASLAASNQIDYRLKDVFENNMSFLEYQESENVVSFMASPLYNCLPSDILKDPKGCEKLVANLPEIMKAFSLVDPTIDMGEINLQVCNMVSISNYLTNNMPFTMIQEGKISTEKLLNGKFIVDGNEKARYADLEDAFKSGNKDKIQYVEYSETKKKEIQEALKGDVIITIDKQKQLLTDYIEPIAHPAEGQGIINKENDFKKTHSIFSKDTKQFKEMEESLKKVSDLAKQYDEKYKDIDKASKLGMDLKEAIAELKEKATTYRDKKQNEKDTQKRFSSRSQKRLDLANKLLDDISKTIKVEDPTKTANNPFRKSLTEEKQNKLDNDIKEKAIVEEKQKVKNEPVKEVSLEQGNN